MAVLWGGGPRGLGGRNSSRRDSTSPVITIRRTKLKPCLGLIVVFLEEDHTRPGSVRLQNALLTDCKPCAGPKEKQSQPFSDAQTPWKSTSGPAATEYVYIAGFISAKLYPSFRFKLARAPVPLLKLPSPVCIPLPFAMLRVPQMRYSRGRIVRYNSLNMGKSAAHV